MPSVNQLLVDSGGLRSSWHGMAALLYDIMQAHIFEVELNISDQSIH